MSIIAGLQAADTVDAPFEQDVEDEGCDSCLYVMIDSMDRLQLNVTPQGIAVIQDVVEVCLIGVFYWGEFVVNFLISTKKNGSQVSCIWILC